MVSLKMLECSEYLACAVLHRNRSIVEYAGTTIVLDAGHFKLLSDVFETPSPNQNLLLLRIPASCCHLLTPKRIHSCGEYPNFHSSFQKSSDQSHNALYRVSHTVSGREPFCKSAVQIYPYPVAFLHSFSFSFTSQLTLALEISTEMGTVRAQSDVSSMQAFKP